MNSKAMLATAVSCLFASISSPARAADLAYEWYTVANNGDAMPTAASRECSSCHDGVAGGGTATAKRFNSYNQPAINRLGVVVFRARSRGGEGQGQGQAEPERGIYMRHLAQQGPLYAVYRRHGTVPPPNNTTIGKDKALASFNEFPSVPRIDSGSDTMATRGQSTPVWTYTAPDGTETRTGTAGVYTNLHRVGATAASMLGDVYAHDASGAVVQSFPQFQVPVHTGVTAGTGFDQFPGSPAVTERTMVVFKGNFTAGGQSRTGVFYRDVVANKGLAPVELIAASRYTDIPGCKSYRTSKLCKFGSTAPPSADGKYAVFVGYDDEGSPTRGGIYRARLGNKPITLETVVQVYDQVPGEPTGTKFRVFGESVTVASGGRLVVFWGGWGEDRLVTMVCPAEGNAAMRKACRDATPPGTTRPVPAKQGFFVRDMQLGTTTVIAKSGSELVDFVYWNFSGRVPGKGEGEEGDDIEEPARWRSATFGAVSGSGVPGIAAFKAKSADGEQGLYLRRFLPSGMGELVKLLKTGDPAAAVDPEAPAGAVISALGIERDGFRGNWLAVNVSMLSASDIATAAAGGEASEEDTGWAGIYAARFISAE